ncbi:MAG: hypothetical protein GY855_06435 [candidate division Zixibacteria bacterium]|nr:hypothetical protein [candidate division Zixibacteria bacterium]
MFRAYVLIPVLLLLSVFPLSCGDSSRHDQENNRHSNISEQSNSKLLFSGEYYLYNNTKIVGCETLSISRTESENILCRSELTIKSGYKHQQHSRFLIDKDRNIKDVIIRNHSGGITRTATIDDIGSAVQCSISTGDGRCEKIELKKFSEWIIYFEIPVFLSSVVKKLNLLAGESKDIKTIYIEPGTLKIFDAVFRYCFIGYDTTMVPAGKFRARKYCISDLQEKNKKTFWINENDIILSVGDNPEGNNIYQLNNYTTAEDSASH